LDAAEESLKRSGVRWRTVLECPMLSGVQAAVDAGLGVSALNPRNLTPAMVAWEDGPKDLPDLSEVIRTGSSADDEVLAALRETLSSALVERGI
jgi:DNA-binding transcriptional LysR family regulator